MSGTTASEAGRFRRRGAQAGRDWQAIEASPEFQELVKQRRSFLVPATIVFLVVGIGYLLLAAFDHGLMGKQVFGGIPLAFLAAVSQILLTWILCGAYLRKADSAFEPLEERAATAAGGHDR